MAGSRDDSADDDDIEVSPGGLRVHDQASGAAPADTPGLASNGSRFIPWEFSLADRRFTRVGRQAVAILGFPLDAWRRDGFWPNQVHPDDRERAVAAHDACTRSGEDQEVEYRMFAADGRAVWLRSLVTLATDEAGRPVGLSGVMLSVEAEQQALQAARQSEQRFRDFADAASDWFWETDENHAYCWISDGIRAKAGVGPEWFLGRRRVDIADTGIDPAMWEEYERRLAARQPYRGLVMRIGFPDGPRWVRSSGVPVFDRSGRFRGYRGTGRDVTAQVEAEEQSRRALELFENAIESLPVGFSLYDADDRFVTCNSETRRMMGPTVALAQPGTPFEEIVRSAIDAGFIPAARDDPEGYVRRRMERHRNPEGPLEVEDKHRWLQIHERRLPDGGTVTVHTDITARVLAERDTERALALFRSAIDSIPDGFALFDADDRFVTCNDSYRTPAGEPRITIEPGTTFETLLRRAVDRGSILDALDDPEGWIRWRMERHRNPAGPFDVARKDCWLRIQESRMADGGTVTIHSDITARVLAERETERALALFRSAIDSIPDGFALFDADDRFVTCNVPYRTPENEPPITIEPGTPFETLLRGAVAKGQIPEAFDDPEGWISRRMAMHRNPQGPFELERRNRWLRIQESRMPDGGTVIVLTDITREKQREEQLRQTQKMDALGKLTGGLAHDFNNLLAVIAGNMELVAAELGDRPSLLRKIEAAVRASARGATLTRSLLAFARQQPLHRGEVNLNRMVADMSELIRRTIPENIEIRFAPGEGVWPCTADAGLLQNALLNLVVNARDAMPDGGTLTISTAVEQVGDKAAAPPGGLCPGDYAVLSVADTGTGMPQEVAERAFEPFFTMKPVGKGTGLGLAMVYGFARQSEGDAAISSTVGGGTTVRLWLPRWQPGPAPVPHAADADAAAAAGEQTGRKVLVVEDDPDLLTLVVSQLHSLGYRAEQADTGVEGLAAVVRHDDLALLLTDIVLAGGMKGTELAQQAVASRPGLRVVLMSGYTEEAVLPEDLVAAGATLLQKPFSRAQLSAALANALGTAAAGAHRPA